MRQKIAQTFVKRSSEHIDSPPKIDNIWHNQFRGRARRWRAQVGHEIANRKINFVTDCRDDWHANIGNCSRDDLFIERPQILNAAATPGDHN
jgi:hypothetical protein